jgi:hypothetical protein
MTTTRRLGRIAAAGLAAALTLGAAQLALAAPSALAQPAAADGFVRLAHLSPNTPPVDVYLYSFGSPSATPVLKHVAYGNVGPFQQVAPGTYGVAMRPTGSSSTTTPVVTGSFTVAAGDAYTVAALGPESGLRLQVFTDPQATKPGSALVQVIQASLKQNKVSVTAGTTALATSLAFGKATSFAAAPAGTWPVKASGPSATASSRVSLADGSVHTLVVLDSTTGLAIDDLTDAAGSTVAPKAGVQTGFGGTAAVPGAPMAPWAVAGLFGLGLIGFGLARSRRRQPDAR